MRIEITAHVYFHDSKQLDRIEEAVSTIFNQGAKSMSAISDFSAKQKAYNDRMDAAIQGLTGDVKALNDKIKQMQNSAGTITPEDQALLDQLESHADSAISKLEALDNETAPTPPTDTTGGVPQIPPV